MHHPQYWVTKSNHVNYSMASFVSYSVFFELYCDLSRINTTKQKVGKVNGNQLNTEGLANGFVAMNEVCRAWRI